MKNKFTKLMAALALLLFIAPPLVGWGQTRDSYSYTFNAKVFTANPQTQTLNNVDWAFAGTGGDYFGYDGTKGQQFGSGNKPYSAFTLSTSGISGTITEIKVNTSGANGIAGTLNVTVDGAAFGSSYTLTSTATSVTFSGSASGAIVFNYAQTSSKAIYIKSITVTTTDSNAPSISAENVEIAYNAEIGSIEYTINNPVDGGEMTASTEATWISNLADTPSPVSGSGSISFTCTANDAASARTATVTLTYTYGDNQTVTKDVTVTQDGNPNLVDNIENITAAGTYTVKGTIVAMNTRGFVLGDGTGYIYYYYGSNFNTSSYAVGDKVKLSGSVIASGTVFEFNSSTTITPVTESNYQTEDPTVLTGSQMQTRVGSTTNTLSSYVQYQGKLTISTNGNSTYYNITDIEGATTAQGSISFPISTTWSSLNGKNVVVTGYFVGVSSSKYYNTMIGSIEEVASTEPFINLVADGVIYTPVDAYHMEFTYLPSGGQIDKVEYGNFQSTLEASDFQIQYCDAAGQPSSETPDWFGQNGAPHVVLNTSDNLLYLVVETALNEGPARTCYFKVGAANGTVMVYSDLVTVTQAANPNYVNNISDITEVGTAYTVRGTVVATNSRGFVMGDGTGYVYYYKNGTVSQSIGDMVKVSGTTGTYGQIIQFTNTATVEEATTSNYNGTPAAEVITAVPDYSTGYHLSTYLEFEGALSTATGSNNTINYLITLGEAQIQISYPTTAQTNTLSALVGKNVHVKGYFSGINSSGKFSVMLESVAEAPYINIVGYGAPLPDDPYILNFVAYSGNQSRRVLYGGFELPGVDPFFAEFYDAENNVVDQPEWVDEVTVESWDFNGESGYRLNVGVLPNDGDARTTYLKVGSYLNPTDAVYSDLVTVIQTAPSPAIIFDVTEISVAVEGVVDTVLFNYEYIAAYGGSSFYVKYCDADGNPIINEPNWMIGTCVVPTGFNAYGVKYFVAANDGAARSAYFKVCAQVSQSNPEEIESNLVTINQAAYVVDYATLPFNWTSNYGTAPVGVTNNGVGTGGSGSSAYLKFDTDGDNIILKINERPGTLEYDVKGNAGGDGWEGTLTVETSTNGTEWVTVATYSDLSTSQYETKTEELGEDVRYIKWTYSKTIGNLAMNDIHLAKYVEPAPYITLIPDSQFATNANLLELPSDAFGGYLEKVEYGYFSNPLGASDFTIQYCDAVGELITKPDWIADINVQFQDADLYLYVSVYANEGEERTAYFKVGAYLSVTEVVYSDVVTVTQAAAPQPSITFIPNLTQFTTDGYHIQLPNTNGGGFIDQVVTENFQGTLVATDFHVAFCDVTGFLIPAGDPGIPDWIGVEVVLPSWSTGPLYLEVAHFANEGEARTCYFKVWANDGETAVYSDIVTVTQAAYVIDYATLPFGFNGGRADIANINGLTANGLGTDYNANDNPTTRLKFDGTGDWLKLKLNSVPAAITFDIKGNNFRGGTFNVQTSTNDITYTDLGTYTELGNTQTITLFNTDDAVRYIRWIYTNKVTGNVGLGNIIVTKPESITGNTTWSDPTQLTDSTSYIVGNGITLTLEEGFFNNPELVPTDPYIIIIKEGGQLVTPNPVPATMRRVIMGYNPTAKSDWGGWYFISSPLNTETTSVSGNTNLLTGEYDLYSFDENETEEWRNFKYTANNLTAFNAGEGYLYANSGNQDISFSGEMRASAENTVFNKSINYTNGKHFAGWNLVGNPFPTNAKVSMAYYKMNSTSEGLNAIPNTAEGIIAPMEGVFVNATTDINEVTFTATTAAVTPLATNAKGVVNIDVESEGELLDRAIVTINNCGMLGKLNLNKTATKLYIKQGEKDYAIVASGVQGEMPVNFKASKNGSYTISVNAENLEMNYLHLIDNRTGADIDLLANPSYTFEAKKSDYASRFKLVFSANNSTDENGNETFAFFNGSEWCISNIGEATLQVVDVTGRIISTETVNGNATLTTDNLSAGVYVMRLVNGNDVKTQKVVVR